MNEYNIIEWLVFYRGEKLDGTVFEGNACFNWGYINDGAEWKEFRRHVKEEIMAFDSKVSFVNITNIKRFPL